MDWNRTTPRDHGQSALKVTVSKGVADFEPACQPYCIPVSESSTRYQRTRKTLINALAMLLHPSLAAEPGARFSVSSHRQSNVSPNLSNYTPQAIAVIRSPKTPFSPLSMSLMSVTMPADFGRPPLCFRMPLPSRTVGEVALPLAFTYPLITKGFFVMKPPTRIIQ